MSTIAINRIKTLTELYIDKVLDRVAKRSGPLRPIEVEKAVCRAIDEGAQVFSNTVYAPNRITVRINPADLRRFSKFMNTFRRELYKSAENYIRSNFSQDQGNNTAMDIVEDPKVTAGEVVCEAEFND